MEKIKGTDSIKDFPERFNELVDEIERLSKNSTGIKIATWITALATAVMAVVAILPFLK